MEGFAKVSGFTRTRQDVKQGYFALFVVTVFELIYVYQSEACHRYTLTLLANGWTI